MVGQAPKQYESLVDRGAGRIAEHPAGARLRKEFDALTDSGAFAG